MTEDEKSKLFNKAVTWVRCDVSKKHNQKKSRLRVDLIRDCKRYNVRWCDLKYYAIRACKELNSPMYKDAHKEELIAEIENFIMTM